MIIQQLLELVISKKASDLHLSVGFPPIIRVHGALVSIPGEDEITENQMESLISPLITTAQKNYFKENLELDFSFGFENKGRFRVNLYFQKGHPAAALRLIPLEIRSLEELGFPPVIEKLCDLKQGFIIITGPTGHGKSTALAAFIQKINKSRAEHILTVEDPVEYVYPKGKSLISQREVSHDTKSWENALRSALREDPNVVLVGEMRDLETVSAAMTIAETGHLVFTTLHTNSAAQTIDRIVDVFPEDQQQQIRIQLSATLEAVVSLRLIPTINPGRVLATEILFATPAVRNVIREEKTHMIDNIIQTSAEMGMVTLEASLATLVKTGKITSEEATRTALHPETLMKLLR